MAKPEAEQRHPTSFRIRPSMARAIKVAAAAEGITSGEWIENHVIDAIPAAIKKAVVMKATREAA